IFEKTINLLKFGQFSEKILDFSFDQINTNSNEKQKNLLISANANLIFRRIRTTFQNKEFNDKSKSEKLIEFLIKLENSNSSLNLAKNIKFDDKTRTIKFLGEMLNLDKKKFNPKIFIKMAAILAKDFDFDYLSWLNINTEAKNLKSLKIDLVNFCCNKFYFGHSSQTLCQLFANFGLKI
ncbi:hypothetical protein MHBO_000454, partial [Bonamia ostreae]